MSEKKQNQQNQQAQQKKVPQEPIDIPEISIERKIPGKTYFGTIIGEGNNRYKRSGCLIDQFGDPHGYEKDPFSYPLSPGTPVTFVYVDAHPFTATNVRPRYGRYIGGLKVLYDGCELHPLIQIYNNIATVFLREVSGFCDGEGVDEETHHLIMLEVLRDLEKTYLDEAILKELYQKKKRIVLDKRAD